MHVNNELINPLSLNSQLMDTKWDCRMEEWLMWLLLSRLGWWLDNHIIETAQLQFIKPQHSHSGVPPLFNTISSLRMEGRCDVADKWDGVSFIYIPETDSSEQMTMSGGMWLLFWIPMGLYFYFTVIEL